MIVADQTKAVIWEMKNNKSYAKTWETLNNPDSTHSEMIQQLVSNYERPKNVDAAISQRMGHFAGLPKEFAANEKVTTATPTTSYSIDKAKTIAAIRANEPLAGLASDERIWQ